jgi:galactose-1-phosphate uridylyltransferase
MPVEHRKEKGQLLWVSNPFTGTVTYFTDILNKRSGFPRPTATAGDAPPASASALQAQLAEARRICPFCPGNEHLTTAEVLRVSDGGKSGEPWRIRVFNNLFPRIPVACTGYRNESYVLVEDPRHFRDGARHAGELLYTALLPVRRFQVVFRTAVEVARIAAANPDVHGLALRKNQGPRSGASQPHVHTQIIGLDRVLPPVARESEVTRGTPALWREIIQFVRDEGFLIEEIDDCYLYFCPFGTFPRSYEVVDLASRGTIGRVADTRLDVFAALLHRALEILGDTPLDYEIHDGDEIPLHAHINGRHYPYSNIAGTLNLPAGAWGGGAIPRPRSGS